MIQLEHDKTLQKENLHSLLLCEGRPYDQSIRKIFSSEDIGIVLIGNLKVCGLFIRKFKLFQLPAPFELIEYFILKKS